MGFLATIERTVGGMGYDLVDVERSAGGLLRVTIDRLPGQRYATGEGEALIVEDCERVTRQLQYVLEVEGVDYHRLEVSSPGLDRPLKKPADWLRFLGFEVDVILRQPFMNRKRWRGTLLVPEASAGAVSGASAGAVAGEGAASADALSSPLPAPAPAEAFRLLLPDDDAAAGAPARKSGPARRGAKPRPRTASRSAGKPGAATAEPAALRVLDFTLDEVREARLVPVIDFKGRRHRAADDDGAPTAEPSTDNALPGGLAR